jgi:hypothetical protein
MRRFWFEFGPGTLAQLEAGQRTRGNQAQGSAGGAEGVGVTGRDERECLDILRARVFDGRSLPTVNRVIADVDVSTLGDHVLSNMEPPIWRGIWFPAGFADPPTS